MDQQIWAKTAEPRRQLRLNLSKTRHSSSQTTIEIRLRHKHEKWTNFFNGSTVFDEITSPWSYYLLQIPKSIEPESFLSSALSSVQHLYPHEKNKVTAELAAEIDGELGVCIVVGIEVEEESEEYDRGEIRELINRDSALSKEEDDLGVCSMCLRDMLFDETPVGKLLPCRHYFHDSCIFEWFSDHSYCPLCELEIAVVCTSNLR